MSVAQRVLKIVEPAIFRWRWVTLGVLVLITVFLGYQAALLKPDAGWLKMVPKEHPYMQTFMEYYDVFGGANRILVAVHNKDGSIYEPEFMQTLKNVHDAVFYIPGVQRSQVTSIFSPKIMYVKNTPTGLAGASVMPASYQPEEDTSQAMMNQLRSNVSKADVIGRLVSNDQTSALVIAGLLEYNPLTDQEISYDDVGNHLEQIRTKYEDEDTSIHIIGFAKIVDDMLAASTEVAMFFVITLILVGLLLWGYTGSFVLGMLPLICSIVAVIWEMGLLHAVGFGLDPFAILVPFLILSVSVSHGVQYVNAWATEVADNRRSPYDASLNTFRRLAIPGIFALLTDVAGFLTILLIDIQVIREMALNATFGMLAIIITNKLLMPILLTVANIRNLEKFQAKHKWREQVLDGAWRFIARHFTSTKGAVVTLLICGVILGWSIHKKEEVVIGSTQKIGVPELKPDSRFNQDARFIANHFALGVNQLNVIAESKPNSCIRYEIMAEMDRFAWHMKNLEGVRETLTMLDLVKLAYVGLSEGRLNAQVIPRNRYALAQAFTLVPTESGLVNVDCSAYNIHLFTSGTQASLIQNVVAAVKDYRKHEQRNEQIEFRLASGNVGVKAATNEVVRNKENQIVLFVYLAIILILFSTFRTLSGVLCVILPLALVSISAYGVMVLLDIGMKVATLPVIALAAGIGVDYGVYIYAMFAAGLRKGLSLEEAYFRTLQQTGKAVVFTGIALGLSVGIWMFSDLQFQIDMGMMLVYMFTANMFGAILVLPALARFLARGERNYKGEDIFSGADEDGDETASRSQP